MITLNGNTIHLQGKDISYIILKTEGGELLHFYFGKKIADCDYSLMEEEWREEFGYASNQFPLDVYPQEYPAYGWSDLRNPAYQVIHKYGNAVSHPTLKDCIIHKGTTVEVKGMPCLFPCVEPANTIAATNAVVHAGTKADAKVDTLEIIMHDEAICLKIHLFYTIFEDHNIIARNAVLTNCSDTGMELLSAYSFSLDLPMGDYDMIHFAGTWGRERDMIRTPLKMGMKAEAENARGGSGHQVNPFVMIASSDCNEIHGEVYGMSLIYSGNHSTVAKVDQFGGLRVQQGLNPHQFHWLLASGESFHTPQSILCYSANGFGEMTREYHDVFRKHLMRSKWTNECRPILINNWEGTYFDFTEEKLLAMARRAKEAGIELFVLDDGWFGKRNDDRSSLGDWFVNHEKLPSGIDGLATKINQIGLKFGLWFEPEMVSPDSELYRKHPDWSVKVTERTPIEIRHQYVLDLSKDEVCDYIIDAMSKILSQANIEYVKWDMNRQITDMPYLGFNHKYTLGYYKIMSAITSAFPNVLFEGCSAGGGRFDAGVLAYMPQIWASDNSDAIARLKIQYSTSMCYPVYSVSSHVTASPNHQCGRITDLKTRGDVAYAGTFGYELDITACDDKEFAEIKEQLAFEKSIRHLVCNGDFYRLVSPYDSNYCAWEIVSKDKKQVLLFTCKVLAVANTKNPRIKLMGLEPDKQYLAKNTGNVYGGDMLMYRGIKPHYAWKDFSTEVLFLEML